MIYVLAVLYAPLWLRLPKLNRRLGAAEYLFGHLRDHTFGLACMFLATYDFSVPHVLGAALAVIAYLRHVHAGLAMTEFMRANPTVHPQEFFDRYYDRLGPQLIAPPANASRTIDPTNVDFTSGAPKRQSLLPLARALYDTGIFARSAYRSLVTCGPGYGRDTFDAMATLWGSRVLQLFKTRLTVNGIDSLERLDGKLVLAFNHKSHLDFVFAFFALSTARAKNGRRIRVRYIAAKDHFVDNALVYSWLGVGKLIEAVDMVFIDRKGKGKEAIGDAAQKLATLPIDIAIFPQGTRAKAHKGLDGSRADAGYYSVTPLKKGAAHLALGTAQMTDQRVHIVCFGIDGTATIVPKGAFKVETEAHVHFQFGGTITVDERTDVEMIQERIHLALTRALAIDAKLLARLREVVPKARSTDRVREIDAACTLEPEAQRRALEAIGSGLAVEQRLEDGVGEIVL